MRSPENSFRIASHAGIKPNSTQRNSTGIPSPHPNTLSSGALNWSTNESPSDWEGTSKSFPVDECRLADSKNAKSKGGGGLAATYNRSHIAMASVIPTLGAAHTPRTGQWQTPVTERTRTETTRLLRSVLKNDRLPTAGLDGWPDGKRPASQWKRLCWVQ